MKYLLLALTVASVALSTTPAAAHVVQATTSLSLTDVDLHDKPELDKALKTAVDGVLRDVIAFKPTVVTLTDAQIIGHRLYLRLLIADEEGERTIEELSHGNGDAETVPPDGIGRADIRI